MKTHCLEQAPEWKEVALGEGPIVILILPNLCKSY